MVAQAQGFDSPHLQERSGLISERCWGCHQILVPPKDLACPRDRILDPDATRLWTNPELEVLGSVVVPQPVEMMDRLIRKQGGGPSMPPSPGCAETRNGPRPNLLADGLASTP